MSGAEFPAAVAAIAALDDPIRRALYRYIAAQGGPVGREDAAAAAGVPRHVARFHLDRLYEAGLLEVEYRRPAGRRPLLRDRAGCHREPGGITRASPRSPGPLRTARRVARPPRRPGRPGACG